MDTKSKIINPATLAALFTIISIFACLIWVFNPFSILDIVMGHTEKNCPLPPATFSKADLVGTWIARRLNDTDTLNIRSDGKYQQIVHIEYPRLDYESEWQDWHVETTETGLTYLYLDGIDLCAVLGLTKCGTPGWGEAKWYDPCQDRWVSLPDAGLLVVMGVPSRFVQPPRGITLMLIISSEQGWGYELQGQ